MSVQAKYWAIMPAAGIGSRMESTMPKQYLKLAGKTIIEHSIDAILRLANLELLIVCISENDRRFSELPVTSDRITTELGGESRAQSVLNGVLALGGKARDDDWVLVHDAARPCLQSEDLNRLLASLESDPVGGVLAVKANDTLKLSTTTGGQDRVAKTVDRSQIWLAQTPQMFRYGLLREALEHCKSEQLAVTDEASALEQIGHSVKLIRGSYHNIKVTTPDDRKLAQFLLSRD